jgi:putative lipoprotein
LKDVTKVGASPEILGRTVVENAGQIPIGFVVVYDASKFGQGHIYGVQASIYDGNRMLFTTDES